MLSWLERGLAEPGDSGEITEFLIAPLQPKGEERGTAKQWVDRVYRERESQEMRRILYVAATRAREELHFLARPAYKAEADGTLSLAEPGKQPACHRLARSGRRGSRPLRRMEEPRKRDHTPAKSR